MASTQDIEALAAQIGENVYIDIAKWHLYLNDAHLHTVVAERVYPILEDNSLSKDAVASILQSISVKLGGGATELSLDKLIPSQGKANLVELLEEYQRDM